MRPKPAPDRLFDAAENPCAVRVDVRPVEQRYSLGELSRQDPERLLSSERRVAADIDDGSPPVGIGLEDVPVERRIVFDRQQISGRSSEAKPTRFVGRDSKVERSRARKVGAGEVDLRRDQERRREFFESERPQGLARLRVRRKIQDAPSSLTTGPSRRSSILLSPETRREKVR